MGKILFRPQLMLKIRQLSHHKMNVNIPPKLMSNKVKRDEEYFSWDKYSLKRLKKVCQKVKNMSSMQRTLNMHPTEPIIEYESEDY